MCLIWWAQILWRRKIWEVRYYHVNMRSRYQNYRISFVEEEVNDKCWKYSLSQLSQITPSGGSQDNWFVIILAVTWGTSSQVIETVAFLRFLILYHHIYSELRPDPRKCLQDHNKEWLEWNGKKDAKKYSLIIWNLKKIDINCQARYCWCNSRITIDSETDLVVDLSSTGHIYFLLSKFFSNTFTKGNYNNDKIDDGNYRDWSK